MSTSLIIIRHNRTSSVAPSTLNTGELALNTADGKLWYGDNNSNAQLLASAGGGGTVFPYTGSAVISGSLIVTGSITSTGGFTGSIQSASYAATASYAPLYLPLTGGTINGNVTVNGTASVAFLNVTIESASVIYSSGSNVFGDATNDTQTLIGTVIVSGSQQITGSLNAPNITGSLYGTASWAVHALTASSADSFVVRNSLTASGLIYPTADDGEFSFIQTNGAGVLSLQYVRTINQTVYNGETFTLVKGTPVYISGSQGANPKVYAADASNPAKMPVIYIVADNITTGNTGRAVVLGDIEGIDLTGYPAGTEVYAAPGGGWTSTRPTGSAIVQVLGYVTKEGTGGKGIVLNPGPANLPNLTSGSVWVGNSSSIPIAISTSSLYVNQAVSASYATTASFAVSASWAPGGGLKTKAGSVTSSSFAGSPYKTTVTFSTPFTNNNYAPTITGEDARTWTIESKVSGSFVINSNSSVALTGTTYWTAIATGES